MGKPFYTTLLVGMLQMYWIHTPLCGQMIPLLYFLLPDKAKGSYCVMLQGINHRTPSGFPLAGEALAARLRDGHDVCSQGGLS